MAAILLWVATLFLLLQPALAQKPGAHPDAHSSSSGPPVPSNTDTTEFSRLPIKKTGQEAGFKSAPKDTCYLPPLSTVKSPTVPTANLQAGGKAKKEYGEACAALKEGKLASAEEHLRKALQQTPNYPAAAITLGQLLAAQRRVEEGHKACSDALAADASYVPSYLCLSDIAARQGNWEEVLTSSSRAIELDPTADALAYDYHAAANLKLHHLPEAEKSALKAVEIDKSHSSPRLHFLLAQIYEASGDPANEAVQLREYLKFVSDPAETERVKQYLADVEKRKAR